MKNQRWALILILVLTGASALMGAGANAPWVGVLWTKGGVSVGSARVSSGTTVLPGDVITTSGGASAWLRFRSPASTVLMEETEVVLLASDSAPSFLLRHGTVLIDDKAVDPVQIAVRGGYVLVKGDAQAGAECEMASLDNTATVSVKRGIAEIHALGAPLILYPGQSARVEAAPQAGQPVAGKIYREIPQGVIQREGQTEELPLQLNEVINWNDLVRTLQTGRAQILLLDGSTLNVGARSSIKILKHDPQAQQTEIEMTVGRVEATAQKITTPGGKFELHTRSAVIGTIDTAYVAETDEKGGTRVCGVEGVTLVKSSDPKINKSVRVHKHECTYVPFGGAPTDPVLDPGEMTSLLHATAIAAPGEVAGGGLSTTEIAAIAGAAGIGAIIAGVVLASGPSVSRVTP